MGIENDTHLVFFGGGGNQNFLPKNRKWWWKFCAMLGDESAVYYA